MSYHAGRLIDHIHLKVRDLQASRRFYDAALSALELPPTVDHDEYIEADELCLSLGEPITSGLHLAFQAKDREAVQQFHALAAGGRDNGAPGEQHYHPGYYGAFVLDPDGNNIEAVFHGPIERSAPSVVITRVARVLRARRLLSGSAGVCLCAARAMTGCARMTPGKD